MYLTRNELKPRVELPRRERCRVRPCILSGMNSCGGRERYVLFRSTSMRFTSSRLARFHAGNTGWITTIVEYFHHNYVALNSSASPAPRSKRFAVEAAFDEYRLAFHIPFWRRQLVDERVCSRNPANDDAVARARKKLSNSRYTF